MAKLTFTGPTREADAEAARAAAVLAGDPAHVHVIPAEQIIRVYTGVDVVTFDPGKESVPLTATLSDGGVASAWDLSAPSVVGHVVFSALPKLNNHLPADGRIYSRASYPDLSKRLGRVANGIGVFSTRNTPADNGWASVCWSPELSLFVAVGNSGTGNRVMTSPDGITWTARTSAADNNWFAICWSPELSLFVAVSYSGTSNRVMTSPDGVAWTIRTSAADNNWRSVCWSPGLSLFVAVANSGAGNRVMTSPDGVTWTARTTPVDNNWYSVCWSPALSLFVAISNTGVGNRLMTSPDGIAWAIRTSPADLSWYSICWSPELAEFVAVSASGTGIRAMTAYGCTYNPLTDFAVPKITAPAGCYAHILAG